MSIRVHVKDFQSIADATVEIDGFTVVTGNNNCGKSALMRAIRSAFQNARGTSYIRHGKPKTLVELDLGDGHTLSWEKGRTKGDKPTYSVDGGPPIHPGQGVPDAVHKLGVSPLTIGGREIWPQFAPQFTGQVFLLDQPGSMLAEAVADVERVGHLNDALRALESDRRATAGELRVRLQDRDQQELELNRFQGLDATEQKLVELEQLVANLKKIEKVIATLTDLRDHHQQAARSVEFLSGIQQVGTPIEKVESLREMQMELITLEDLKKRAWSARVRVERLTGIGAGIGVPDSNPTERILAALQVLEGLKDQRTEALKKVRAAEAGLQSTKEECHRTETKVQGLLGDLGECPICGSVTLHAHGEEG